MISLRLFTTGTNEEDASDCDEDACDLAQRACREQDDCAEKDEADTNGDVGLFLGHVN